MGNTRKDENSAAPGNSRFYSEDLAVGVGRAEGRLDGHDRELHAVNEELRKLRQDIASLREWRAGVVAIASVVGGIGGAAISALVSWLSK